MARLSLWRNHKSKDYYFIDSAVKNQFEIGGTGVYVHKYLGPDVSDQKVKNKDIPEITIQDVVFMENRDRKYESDIYELRGVYQVSDADFDLSQFGLFLQTDTIFITFHINDMIARMGRKLMAGDVLELPHQIDDTALDTTKAPVRKFYVVQDASKGQEGYSPTWWPHIWRVKCVPLTDSQEFKGILGDPNDPNSISAQQSTLNTLLDITDAIVAEAESNSPTVTPLTQHLVNFADETPGWEPGQPVPIGDSFPMDPNQGDLYIRNDFKPHRLFQYRGKRWHRMYDNVDTSTWTSKTINAGGFINNENVTAIGKREFDERQALSKIVTNRKPKADN